MPIACIGTIVEVTPGDEIQIIHAGGHEFIDDREPFRVRVDEVMREDGVVVAVVGPVISGPNRYSGLIATLMLRIDGADWERDQRSAANFKVSISKARRVADFPIGHPDGTSTDGYPLILRYGSIRVVS